MGEMMDAWLRPEVIAAVDRMKPLAKQAGCTMAQFALAWVLKNDNVASAIVGASRPEQLVDNCGAVGLKIDPALFAEAEKIAAEIPAPRA